MYIDQFLADFSLVSSFIRSTWINCWLFYSFYRFWSSWARQVLWRDNLIWAVLCNVPPSIFVDIEKRSLLSNRSWIVLEGRNVIVHRIQKVVTATTLLGKATELNFFLSIFLHFWIILVRKVLTPPILSFRKEIQHGLHLLRALVRVRSSIDVELKRGWLSIGRYSNRLKMFRVCKWSNCFSSPWLPISNLVSDERPRIRELSRSSVDPDSVTYACWYLSSSFSILILLLRCHLFRICIRFVSITLLLNPPMKSTTQLKNEIRLKYQLVYTLTPRIEPIVLRFHGGGRSVMHFGRNHRKELKLSQCDLNTIQC